MRPVDHEQPLRVYLSIAQEVAGQGEVSALTNGYLNILVDEIVVDDRQAMLKGSYGALTADKS